MGIFSNLSEAGRPIDGRLPGYAHWQQCLYDRYDALDDACTSLRLAVEALKACGGNPPEAPEHLDDVAALEDIAAELSRDLEATGAKLQRLEAMEREALAREYHSDV